MVRTDIRHFCEACGAEYPTLERAQACEAQPAPPLFAIGTYVGTGVHGWWLPSCAPWALTMTFKEGEMHSPNTARVVEWKPATGNENMAPTPDAIKNWWLPIWRVAWAGIAPAWGTPADGVASHRQMHLLWTPHHANCGNTGGERLAVRFNNPVFLIDKYRPPEVIGEFEAVEAKYRAWPATQIKRLPLL